MEPELRCLFAPCPLLTLSGLEEPRAKKEDGKKGWKMLRAAVWKGCPPPNTVSPAQDAHLREEGQAQAPSVQLDLFLQVIKPLLQL